MSKQGYILRYLLIVRLIRNRRYISLPDLVREVEDGLAYYDDADEVGVSRRTILRDLKEIKSGMDISIEYSRRHKGYYIPEDEDRMSDIERILEQYDLITSLQAREELSQIVFAEKRKARGTEHLNPLIHAIKKSLVVEFLYAKFDNSAPYVRRVMPYALKESQGRWYLLATEFSAERASGIIKSWGLDRIQNLKITKERFVRDRKIDPESEFRDVFGAYSGKDIPVEEIILSFPPKAGRYVEAYPLHESQETLADNGKEIRIRLRLKIARDFIQELLSLTEDMTVISPKHLRKELKDIYRKALKRLD